MLLSSIKLIEINIDDSHIVEQYGDVVTFYMYEDFDIPTYFEIHETYNRNNADEIISLLRRILRTKSGELFLDATDLLPIDLINAVTHKLLSTLNQVRNKKLDPNGDWETAQLITVGYMAKEYGVLPHVIRDTATTYDLMIYDVVQTWDKFQQAKATGKTVQEPSTEELQSMMAAVRGNKDD